MARTWIYQCNPSFFDIDGYLSRYSKIFWSVNQHFQEAEISIGDTVYIWRAQGGQKGTAGIIAKSQAVGLPSERAETPEALPFWKKYESDMSKLRVELLMEEVAKGTKEVVRREWIVEDPLLNDLPILKFANATNFLVPLELESRLSSLWEKTGTDWSEDELVVALSAYLQSRGEMPGKDRDSPAAAASIEIGRSINDVCAKIMTFRSMDPERGASDPTIGGPNEKLVWNKVFGSHSSLLKASERAIDLRVEKLQGIDSSNSNVPDKPTLDRAKIFLEESVDLPALKHPRVPDAVKNKVQSSYNRIRSFRKVGDLYLYLKRFDQQNEENPNPGVYEELTRLGLKTYEDVLPEFEKTFSGELEDLTTLDDFKIGERYTSWDITNFAKSYFNLGPGILPIRGPGGIVAIFIRGTLEGDRYSNEWLLENEELKYYFFSRKGQFDPNFKENAAILNNRQAPIFLFLRDGENYILKGHFRLVSHHEENDGARWFRLGRMDKDPFSMVAPVEAIEADFENRTRLSAGLPVDVLSERLKVAPRIPSRKLAYQEVFIRNADVRIAVLARANGKCEECHQDAPFLTAREKMPYLEVHHRIRLADGGEDTVENAMAVCPNCHRRLHYG